MNSSEFARGIEAVHRKYKDRCGECPFAVSDTVGRWSDTIIPKCMASAEMIEAFHDTIKEVINNMEDY